MSGFLLGVLATVTLGTVMLLATDKDVREGFVTVAWTLLAGGPFLLVIAFVALGRLLPGGELPFIRRPKRISPEALRRTVYRLGSDGWVITWRRGGVLVLSKPKPKGKP